MSDETYSRLAEPFDHTYTLPGKRNAAGEPLQYITGEQCISRLNEVLGLCGWMFEVLDHGQLDTDLWVRGRLTLRHHETGSLILKEQFGGQPLRAGMAPSDSLKAAATDCLKKCASLAGVALYLSEKDAPPETETQMTRARTEGPVEGRQLPPPATERPPATRPAWAPATRPPE